VGNGAGVGRWVAGSVVGEGGGAFISACEYLGSAYLNTSTVITGIT